MTHAILFDRRHALMLAVITTYGWKIHHVCVFLALVLPIEKGR